MANGKDGVDKIVALFRLYEKNMYHIAYAILHDSYQAEDAVMEAFVRLMERNYAIDDPSSDEAKRLVIQVIRSTAIDQYRKNQRESERQVLVEDFTALGEKQDTQPGFAISGEAETMIQNLPDIYRDVLYLRYVKEYTTAQTAAALKIREETVRKRQERALRMLKENKSENGGLYHGTHFKIV